MLWDLIIVLCLLEAGECSVASASDPRSPYIGEAACIAGQEELNELLLGEAKLKYGAVNQGGVFLATDCVRRPNDRA